MKIGLVVGASFFSSVLPAPKREGAKENDYLISKRSTQNTPGAAAPSLGPPKENGD